MFRLHKTSKTCSQREKQELEASLVSQRYWNFVSCPVKADHDRYMAWFLIAHAWEHLLTGRLIHGLSLFLRAFRLNSRMALKVLLDFALRSVHKQLTRFG